MARLFNDKVYTSSAWMNGKKKAKLRNMILFEAEMLVEFARKLREDKPDLYKQLVNEIFGEDERKDERFTET